VSGRGAWKLFTLTERMSGKEKTGKVWTVTIKAVPML
jgi:hypothetical protein